MSPETAARVKVIDEWIEFHEVLIRDLKNEKRRIILQDKKKGEKK